MRFISQYPNYGVQVRKQRIHPLGDGTQQVVQEGLYVKFLSADSGGMIYDRERYIAAERFDFHGSQQEQDEATPVDVLHRLSVFDTDEAAEQFGWTPEEIGLVEAVLTEKVRTTPGALILIEGTPIPPPFPAYDDWYGDPEQLVLKLSEDGFDLNEVLTYEQSFGPKRPEVIEALKIGAEALKELTVHG